MHDVFTWALDAAQHGFQQGHGLPLLASFTGSFFAISGFHKLFNKDKRAQMVRAMVAHKLPQPERMAAFVSLNEFLWGIALMAHLLVGVAAGALMIVLAVAWKGEVKDRIQRSAPYTGWSPVGACTTVMCMAESFYFIALLALLLG